MLKTKFYNFLITGLFVSITTTAYTQQDNGQAMTNLRTDIIPHSPEAEAMGKYGVLPVTLYSGLPSITVPIYDLKTPNLDLPFSLSYNYNGYKPNEIPTWAGIGWSVQGGGSIIRIVKGQVDESMGTNGHYDDYVKINGMVWNQKFLTQIALKQIDPQPDVYIFNVGGYSGKFLLIKGRAYLFPHQNIQIIPYQTGFKLIDDKGNSYTFLNYETTYQKTLTPGSYVPTHKSCWYVSQVISANKKDTVTFGYTSYSYREPNNYIENYTINGSLGTGLNTSGHSYVEYAINGNQISALLLTTVTSRYGNIYFSPSTIDRQDMSGSTGGKYLDYINITNSDGTYSKQLKLNHAYFGTGTNLRLNLQSVVIKQVNPAVDIGQYSFQYAGATGTLPDNGTKGIDMYGYYNGKINNAMLFPTGHFTPSLYTYGDRSSNMQYSQIGILNQITYPTGGYSKLIYEQNKKGLGSTLSDGPGLRIKSITSYNNDCTTQFIKQYTYDNGGGINSGGISGSTLYADCAQYNITTYSAGIKSALSEFSDEQFFYTQVDELTQDYKQGKTRYIYSSLGGIQRDVKLVSQTDYQFNGVNYLPVKDVTNQYHTTVMNDFSATEVLPKTVIGTACNTCNFCFQLQSPDPTQPSDLLTIFGTTPVSSMQSNYTTILNEQHSEYNNLGQVSLQNMTNYYYDNPSHLYPTRIITTNSKGQQLSTYLKYPLDYILGQTTSLDLMNKTFVSNLGVAMNVVSTCLANEQTALQPYQPYHNNTAYNQQQFTTIANQYNCQADFLTSIASATQSRNTAWTNYLSFLNSSISSNSNLWQKGVLWMQANNIISPVIEKYITVKQADGNDYVLSATRNEYNILNNTAGVQAVFPVAISQVELTSPLLLSTFASNADAYYKPQIQFGYDSKLNLAVQNKTLDKKVSYLWDYQNSYPIAQVATPTPGVTDISYTSFEAEGMGNWQLNNGSINSAIGVTGTKSYTLGGVNSISRSGLSAGSYVVSYWLKNATGTPSVNSLSAIAGVSKNNWTLFTITLNNITSVAINGSGVIDELRLYPANAQMVTYTYKPIAGISSECDAANHITNYTYDGIGRLTIAQDQDNNILKSYSYNYSGVPSCAAISTSLQSYSGTYTRNNCGTGQVGSQVNYYLPVGAYSSTISQADAEQKAVNDVSANGQAYANLVGTCSVYTCNSSNCTGITNKCVNNICETGLRYNSSTIYIKTIPPGSPPGSVAAFYWKCTWHYQWSDGSAGPDNYEYNSIPCELGCVGCVNPE